MGPHRRVPRCLIAVAVGSVVLAGCGHQGSAGAATGAGRASASPTAAVAGQSDLVTGPSSAPQGTSSVVDPVCDSVETMFAKMAAQSARWSPEVQPFDQFMAAQIRNLALHLAAEQRNAHNHEVRAEIKHNMDALDRLAKAMGGHDRDKVLAAVQAMKTAYAPLRGVCRIGGASPGKAGGSKATHTAPRIKPPTPATAVCKKTQEIFVKMGAVSATWSPADHPFDRATAKKTRELGQDLAGLAKTAKPAPVHDAIRASAATMVGIASAMDSRNRSAVYQAIADAQLAYANLRDECHLP